LPETIVAVATALAAVAIASSFRHPPPSSPPSPSPLPPSPLPSLLPASLVTVAITQVVAFTITITLVAVNRLTPLLPLLFPPKPSLSSSHDSTLVANHHPLHPKDFFQTRHKISGGNKKNWKRTVMWIIMYYP
jgi:hypothetical protein